MSRRRTLWINLSLLALTLLIAGCSYNPWDPTRWMNQGRLQLPHLVWAAGLSRLSNADGGSGGHIHALTIFRRAGDGAQQVLVSQDGSLYVAGLDGSGNHRLNMGADCLTATVTPDGRWVGCEAHVNGGGAILQLAALGSNGVVSDAHQVQLQKDSLYSPGKWSPDGRYLATVLDNVLSCDVTVFASPPPHSTFTPVLHITSDAFYNQYLCQAGINTWSDDSARLRLVSDDGSGTPTVDDVDIGPLLTSLNGASTIDIPASDFHAVDKGTPIQVSGWYPTAKMFLYLTKEGNQESLRGVDPTTGEIRTLVTVPYPVHQISDYSWTVDGSQVLLVVNGDECVDCNAAYRSDVYLYTL